MNKLSRGNIWHFRKKFVSGIVIALLIASSLIVLIPFSSDLAVGYSMPDNVSWAMNDLVTNSSGAVTKSGGSDFYVHEDITVPVNSTLNVYPGDTVYFDLATGLTVYGNIYASGVGMNIVTFTSNETDPTFGEWDGITLEYGGGFIDYASISYAEVGLHLINTSLGISNSQFTNNVWGVHVNGGGGEINGNTFIENGILPHPDPFYSVGGGVYLEHSYSGFMENNNFFYNIGGIRVNASYVYVMNNDFYNNTVYGVFSMGSDYWNQSYVNVINNEIVNNENFGIYSSSGNEIYISSNNITHNRVGVFIEGDVGGPGGGGSIYDNYIAHNTENGIEVYGSYGTPPQNPNLYISGNEIVSNTIAGIYCEDSQGNIQSNVITDNWFGVYALNSAPTLDDCYFDSNRYALWANASDIDITNSEIIKSNPVDFYLENDAYIMSLNTTFDDHSVIFADTVSVLEVRWYLHILVINGSGPVDSANVTVSDNPNGTWSGDFVTDSTGSVQWIDVLEYIRDSTSWVFYTPHNITANKNAEIGYAEPIMDISKFVIVDLSPGVTPIAPLPPVDLQITLLGSELELSWGASGDDGAGADDVVSYEIYRAASVNGPYLWVDNVTASDLPTYTWTDSGKGDLDWNNYFYIVRAKDDEGLEDSNENKVGKFVNYLEEEWNLFSTPLIQSNTARETVLQTVDGNYVSVQGYHAGKSRPWLHWHRNKPNQFNDVIEINHKEGYYVDMVTPDYLVTVGKVASSVDINLKSGWNLVGFPSLTDQLRDDALSSIAGKYNMVERFDTSVDKEIRLESTDHMQPGLGYWIHATADCILTITN
jgi:parallel beta-helix repeat protein